MKIGIVGAGNVGRLYGASWAAQGHQVAFGYVRDHARLERFVTELGQNASAREPEDISASSDILVLAPPFERIQDASARVGGGEGKIILDTTNPFNLERTGLVDLGSSTSADVVASLFPRAQVVKALHNLSVEQVAKAFTGPPAIGFLAGNDATAKDVAARLVLDAGLVPFDTGSLESAKLSEAPGPLFMNAYHASDVAGAVADARATYRRS